MIRKYAFVFSLLLCLFMTACVTRNVDSEIKQPAKLKVIQTSTVEKWEVQVKPRLDHKVWVYDLVINYLGDNPVSLSIHCYDNTIVNYDSVKPLVPIEVGGSYDYEPSVYSEKNKTLSFTLSWIDGDQSFAGLAEFKVKPVE